MHTTYTCCACLFGAWVQGQQKGWCVALALRFAAARSGLGMGVGCACLLNAWGRQQTVVPPHGPVWAWASRGFSSRCRCVALALRPAASLPGLGVAVGRVRLTGTLA